MHSGYTHYEPAEEVAEVSRRSTEWVVRPGKKKLEPMYEGARGAANTCSFNVNKKVQLDATVCRHLFTAQSLYMFRVSQHPSSGALKTVSATSGIGHDTGTATSFQRGLIRTGVSESCGMYGSVEFR